jgi:hypothetical protein
MPHTGSDLVAEASPDQVRLTVDLHCIHPEKKDATWVGSIDVTFMAEGAGDRGCRFAQNPVEPAAGCSDRRRIRSVSYARNISALTAEGVQLSTFAICT